MKNLSFIGRITLSVLFFMGVPLTSIATAQDVVEMALEIKWDKGPEKDIQYYQIYMGDTDVFADMEKFGEPILVAINDPDLPDVLQSDMTIEVPPGASTTKHFRITAIDTSGNESDPSESASATMDKEAPAPPLQLKVVVKVVVSEAEVTEQ